MAVAKLKMKCSFKCINESTVYVTDMKNKSSHMFRKPMLLIPLEFSLFDAYLGNDFEIFVEIPVWVSHSGVVRWE